MIAHNALRAPVSREEFLSLYHSEGTLKAAAFLLGLTDEEMGLALLEAQHNKRQQRDRELLTRRLEEAKAPPRPTDNGKVFCGQCDRLVRHEEMISCQRAFCDRKKVAA